MAYIVNFTDPEATPFNVNSFTTDGPVAPNTLQLSSSAVRASTSLVLYGKGHPEYGERIQENLVNLMEHFSGSTPPTFAVSGQVWFSRNTYVMIDAGTGSPSSGRIYRWVDSTNVNGGSWTELTNVGASQPTAVDEVKTSGAQPTSITDGTFWLDTVGSPSVPELYLAVNSSTSNLTSTFLKRELENLNGLVTNTELVAGDYVPQKQLKVYDGVQWKNSGNVFTSAVAPQSPADGDMWYQTRQGSPTNPEDQLYVWYNNAWQTAGYVDIGGGTMTGALSFGLPTPSLVIWGNGGDSNTGPDIEFVSNGLLSSDDNLYIHIDDDKSDGGAGNDVFEVATGSDSRLGSPLPISLFQVQNDGIIRTALATGSPNPYVTLILAGDENTLVNRAYVDGFGGDITSALARITVNETNIELLNGGGSPLEAKVSRSGDTMTGVLTFALTTGSPAASFPAVDYGLHKGINLATPTAPQDAANKQYVDDEVAILLGSPAPVGFNDGVVDAATYDSTTMVLTLTRTEGLASLTPDLSHTHDSSTILQEITTPYLRDLLQEPLFGSPIFGSPITDFPLNATIDNVNDTFSEDINGRVEQLEAPTGREIFTVGVGSPLANGGSPVLNNTSFSLVLETYKAGLNRLQVYVNGVKQYANERAYQKITFSDGFGVSPSARTQLADDGTTYTLDIGVDGGSPQLQMSAPGNDLQLYQDIINNINTDISTVTAVWSGRDNAIVVYSNTTGTGSAIDITTNGQGSPSTDILAALSIVDIGSPAINPYVIGSITPTAGGPVSTVSQNLAYKEVVDYTASTVDATFGIPATSVIFNTQLNPGDVIELLALPA